MFRSIFFAFRSIKTCPSNKLFYKCGYADTKYFQLRQKNVNVFVRTRKRAKANENVYSVFPLLRTTININYLGLSLKMSRFIKGKGKLQILSWHYPFFKYLVLRSSKKSQQSMHEMDNCINGYWS